MTFTRSPDEIVSGLYQELPIGKDPTFGRASLPFTPAENEFRSAKYQWTEGRVQTADGFSVYYQTWHDTNAKLQRNADVLWCHGLNDYAGRSADVVKQILDAGFRLIMPDLPSFGRSSGLHAYMTDIFSLIRALKTVADTVRSQNPTSSGEKRKFFVMGGSLGGWCTLEYGIHFPSEIDGLVILCPMIYSVGDATPSVLIQWIARVLVHFLGWLPVSPANRGLSSSIENEDIFLSDPLTYHGKLRIATGLQLLRGMVHARENLGKLEVPFLVMHGSADRVCDIKGAKQLYEQAPAKDKDIELWPGAMHDLMREPNTQTEILPSAVKWLVEHC
ncbi:alpha/beta-hydrolase [Saitoella complicata NRRL Y-17804]|uniref:Serine aminopeptidase S33 domain-containing protein n=1 Tax=Saitoella complicata (strain BCRC 22490 / CBS 7301 / JCM 7358 / NBRC 10748 / NRRL Y-17804) TaxID=698492 RepID=A0A0E9NL10_SAICN|nr:alpha/beta-hydrolase [Saitoella complicata NRRL Y-17804]ODQ54532.1 alpha/beta-hydrolase [Saitoella complicata NRRL Y-17804]GAO50100.1 hypothetical protein G7K_4235-t1 [Saitoella complicata NRRL Y-17804]